MARKTASAKHIRISKRKLVNLAIILVLLYIIVPQFGKFRSSLQLVEHIHFGWALLGLGLVLATYAPAAATYYVLAKKPLHYLRTVLVQVAGMFANRLVPAGIGAISVNYEYLRRNKHSATEAGAVIAVNNALGIAGHLTLLAIALLVSRQAFTSLALPHLPASFYWLLAAAIAIIFFTTVALPKLRRHVWQSIVAISRKIAAYGRQPRRLVLAWLFSISLTTLYICCLLACALALGIHLSFVQGLIILTLGVAGGTVAPTPGGLIGAEAGLVAGLVACGIASSDALAVTLLYRLFTYWLPLVSGPAALEIVERRNYI